MHESEDRPIYVSADEVSRAPDFSAADSWESLYAIIRGASNFSEKEVAQITTIIDGIRNGHVRIKKLPFIGGLASKVIELVEKEGKLSDEKGRYKVQK